MCSISEAESLELRTVLRERIQSGQALLNDLSHNSIKKVNGLPKLEKKVRQEVKFLEKFDQDQSLSGLKKEHIQCSNLIHLHSIIKHIFRVENPVSVMQPFNLYHKDGSLKKKMNVDIVCDGGFSWVKVVARNPRALQLNSQGGNQYGQRNINDQVKEFVRCSQQNQIMFKNPKVLFVFASGVTRALANSITKKGAEVVGEIVDSSIAEPEEDDDDVSSEDDADEFPCLTQGDSETHFDKTDQEASLDATKLNLDITAMIAYVSSLTNGHSSHVFKEKILSQQAEWERVRPVKPFLDNIFCDKTLVCCESAVRDFKSIISCLGGENERIRAQDFLERLTVVPDQESTQIKNLEFSGKIKDRSRAIFGTGDSMKIVTVTANSGFVRAASGQGVNLAVVLHESRALTEDKQIRAAKEDISKLTI